jgi:glycosyltransferase involved in cell wall biosynthesis
LVANSSSGYDYWERKRPAVPKSLIVNGIPDSLFSSRAERPEPREFEKQTITYVGRLVPHKNVTVLIDAFGRLADRFEVDLCICGTGVLERELRKRVRDLNLHCRVQLRGHLGHRSVIELIRGATLFVNPSRYEGCPNAVLEAMASGCPVAVSDIRSHRDILDDESALFFEAGCPESLLEVLLESLKDRAALARRAAAAREKAESYSLRGVVKRYEEVYRSIVANG